MEKNLLDKLRPVTKEEQKILDETGAVEKSIYTSENDFVVDRKKMLERGKLIDIRTHTRFVHFPRHSHNYIELIYMCSGTTTHIINGTSEVILETGNLLLLNQHATHEILPAGMDDIAVNFIVMPEFFDTAFELTEEENVVRDFLVGALQQKKMGMDYIHFQIFDILPIQNLIENMIWSLVHKQAHKRNIHKMTMGLLIAQLSNYTDRIANMDANGYEQNMMFSILHYIEENYKEGTLTELSELCHQSIPGMSRFIKKHSGRTFQQLLMQKRLNQAAFLLTITRLTVEEVMFAVGYDNSSYFHRIFREKYDMTPKKYRMYNRIDE